LDFLGNSNDYGRQCAEVKAISEARSRGLDLRGARIYTANIRGLNSTIGIHGTYKEACDVCGPLIDFYGMEIVEW